MLSSHNIEPENVINNANNEVVSSRTCAVRKNVCELDGNCILKHYHSHLKGSSIKLLLPTHAGSCKR